MDTLVNKKTKQAPNPIFVKEGLWLQAIMSSANISNIELAEKLGVNTTNFISQWRTGSRSIPDTYMLCIGKMFNSDPIEVRPSLKTFRILLENSNLLEGLSPESKKTLEYLADQMRFSDSSLNSASK